jgi:hypothetical protein
MPQECMCCTRDFKSARCSRPHTLVYAGYVCVRELAALGSNEVVSECATYAQRALASVYSRFLALLLCVHILVSIRAQPSGLDRWV